LTSDADIHLINPEGLEWLFAQKDRPQYDVLIVDESTKFKNSQTKRFKALRMWLPSFRRRWILTGTPVPNGLMDLFGQIYLLDLGRALGRFITHYRRNFFVQSGYGGYQWDPQPDAFPRIIDQISPLVVRMSAEDYLKMPELIFQEILVSLPPAARKVYTSIEDDFYSEFEGGNIVASTAAVAGVKCRQVANGAVYDTEGTAIPLHDAKLEALDDLVEELSGSPVLILYEFEHDKERILKHLGRGEVLGSGLSAARLDSLVKRFNAGSVPILLGHPAGMGHGLNLQGSCRHVIWFGIPWNLEHYDQAIARIYRQGQESDRVFVYHIAAENTLDQKVLRVLGQKDRDQSDLNEALSATSYELASST